MIIKHLGEGAYLAQLIDKAKPLTETNGFANLPTHHQQGYMKNGQGLVPYGADMVRLCTSP